MQQFVVCRLHARHLATSFCVASHPKHVNNKRETAETAHQMIPAANTTAPRSLGFPYSKVKSSVTEKSIEL